jgi:CrcB protein
VSLRLLALVMLGGAFGAGLRYVVGAALLRQAQGGWPWGTFAVNLAGAFLAGLVFAWLEGRGEAAAAWRAFLLVGVLGGMTTFSALMLESLLFAEAERPGLVVAYLGASLAGGLVLVWLGALAGRALQA